MRTFYKDIKSVRNDLVIILLFAMTAIILINFALDDTPELFSGGHKIGVIINNISLSYIAGFIFYFLTVHLKTENDKRKYNEVISQPTFDIIISTDSMLKDILNYKKIEARQDYNNDKDMIFDACRSIKAFEHDAPLHWVNGLQGNWIDFLYNYMLDIHLNIKKLNDRIIYLEPRLSTLISRIENSVFLKQINAIYHNPNIMPNKDLSIFATSIRLYWNIIDELREYAEKEFNDYKNPSGESIGYRKEEWEK